MDVLDADGETINSTRSWPLRQTGRVDKNEISKLFGAEGGQLGISAPNGQILQFVKRLHGRNGALLGYVTLGVGVRYFETGYKFAAPASGYFIALTRNNGSPLVQYHSAEILGNPDINSGASRHDIASRDGWYRSKDALDQNEYWVAARPVRDYPLIVSVGFSKDIALGGWERRATYIWGGTLVAVLCSIFLMRVLQNQIYELLESRKSLLAREAKLEEKSDELALVNGKLDAALNNMSQGLSMFDASEKLLVCNDRYLAIYGLSSETVRPGCTLHDVAQARQEAGTGRGEIDDLLNRIRMCRREQRSTYNLHHLKDGRIIAVHSQPVLGKGWISTHEDVTEHKRSEARIAHMARYDSLTELANRALFSEDMDNALERVRQSGEKFCVYILDLDLFKTVNDSLGHPVGDALLRTVARQLRELVHSSDTVARLGGDEFAILHTCDDDGIPGAIKLAERILLALGEPCEVDGHQITIGASIGIAIAPDHGGDTGLLLRNVDLALYRAKSDGRNCYRFFEPEMALEAQKRRELEVDLRNAISRGEFELHYQTIVDIATQQTCAVEALVRWREPRRGLILPDQFIPLAEEIGVVIPLGEWIIQKACMDACKWPSSICVAVNLSAVQFRDRNLVDVVSRALTTSGLAPERLELEITESVLLQTSQNNVEILHQLKQLGVSIALDDFGTGYSSLSYLKMFPFSKIKIDRSFVADIVDHADSAAIVSAVANLGRCLDVYTTAEGVETEDQLRLLRAAGCTYAQGYLFSRPCSAFEVQALFPKEEYREESVAL
jgi:diguanylate cyclase (GGDEF)-like protein